MASEEEPSTKGKKAGAKQPADPSALVPMTVRLPRKIQKAVRHAAIEEDRLLQNVVTEALVEWLEHHGHSDGLH